MSHLIDTLNRDEIAYIWFREFDHMQDAGEWASSDNLPYQYEIVFTLYRQAGDKERFKQFADKAEYETAKAHIFATIADDSRFHTPKTIRQELAGIPRGMNRISISTEAADFAHKNY